MRHLPPALDESIDAMDPTVLDTVTREMHVGRYAWAVDMLQKKSAKVIVDAACGRGYGTRMLSDVGKAIGVDILPETLAYARGKYCPDSITLLQGDIQQGQFWQRHAFHGIDAIVSFETLEHCEQPLDALKNFYTALRSGGTLLLSVPNGLHERKLADGQPHHGYHAYSYRPQALADLISKAGFDELHLYGQGVFYGFLMGQARKVLNLFTNGTPYGAESVHLGNQKNGTYGFMRDVREHLVQLPGVCSSIKKIREGSLATASVLVVAATKP